MDGGGAWFIRFKEKTTHYIQEMDNEEAILRCTLIVSNNNLPSYAY